MSEEIRSYRDLIVWQKAVDLCVEAYRLSKKLPKEELYALSDQIAVPRSLSHPILRRAMPGIQGRISPTF